LLESLCEDLGELGWEVGFENKNGERAACACRPDSLRRALRNVIENAVRYGDRARVTLAEGADGLEILVDDDGPGIAPSERGRVLERFYRSPGTQGEGNGLGLAIAEEIARVHQSHLQLQPGAEGRGLRVTLTLPVLNAERLELFVLTGASKAVCVRRAFAPEPDVPAGLVLATHRTHWLLDAPAAVEMLAEQAKQEHMYG
jgi:signal transduction histidine kinase